MKKLLIVLFLIVPIISRGQTGITLNPSLGIGLTDYVIGSLSTGISINNFQQLTVGGFIKQYKSPSWDKTLTPQLYGVRVYSKTNLIDGIGAIVMIDMMTKGQFNLDLKGVRIEKTIGLNYMFNKNLGIDAGINFEEYNPLLSSTSPSKLTLRLTYDIFIKKL